MIWTNQPTNEWTRNECDKILWICRQPNKFIIIETFSNWKLISLAPTEKKGFNEHINFVAILINFSGRVPCVHGYCCIKINFISCIACASAISERHMQFNEKSSISCMWIYVGFWRLWFTFHFNWHLFVFVTFCMLMNFSQ